MLRILGLDIATSCGWAYTASDQVTESGTWDFTVKKDESTGMRLMRFRGKLNEILKIGLDLIVYEMTVHQSGYRSGAHVQAELQGVMKLWCEENKIEYKGYSPTSIKIHATGNGKSKKPAMIAAAQKKWKKPFECDDEVDARWILDFALKDMGLVE